MVVFDAAIALFLFSEHVGSPLDPATGKPVDRVKDRIDYLLQELQRTRTKIIIPTPALAEILVRAGKAGPAYLSKLQTTSAIRIEPFDERAAVQVAWMAAQPGDRPRSPDETYAKIKYDRQIAAIAKVCGATAIYSDDGNVRSYARRLQMEAYGLADLALPPDPEPKQPGLFDGLVESEPLAESEVLTTEDQGDGSQNEAPTTEAGGPTGPIPRNRPPA